MARIGLNTCPHISYTSSLAAVTVKGQHKAHLHHEGGEAGVGIGVKGYSRDSTVEIIRLGYTWKFL